MKLNYFSLKHTVVLFFLFVVILLVLLNRETVADFMWKTFYIPQVALFLSTNSQIASDIGNYYFNAEGSGVYNIQKAEKYFEIALKRDSTHTFARHQLSRIQFLRGDFEDALETINEQINIHGDKVISSYYVRGLIYGFTGELEKAEDDFLKFIEVKPKNWGGYNDLAWIYFQQGEYEKAEEYSRIGLDISENNAWLLTTNGVSLLNLNRKEEARTVLQKALFISRELTSDDWLNTNPGNNPYIAQEGLTQMTTIIEKNLKLIDK